MANECILSVLGHIDKLLSLDRRTGKRWTLSFKKKTQILNFFEIYSEVGVDQDPIRSVQIRCAQISELNTEMLSF